MRKKPPQTPALPTAELVAMAGKPTLSAHLRKRVIASFEQRPETLQELQAAASQVPEDLVADPFVAALRRICHPSSRLRLIHRRAIAEVGSAPHGFVALVIEEARTYSLRHYNPASLDDITPWLEVWQERQAEPAATELFLRSACYRLFVNTFAALIGEGSGRLGTVAQETRNLIDKFHHIEFESMLAFALLANVIKKDGNPRDLFEILAAEPRKGEELVLLEFGRAWVQGFLHEDAAGGKRHFEAALAAMDEDCDPWLELFLRLQLAYLSSIQVEKGFPSLEDRMLARVVETIGSAPDSHPVREAFELYWEDLLREQENYAPAIEQLKAAEKLVDEMAATESRIHYLRMRSRLTVATDPLQALHDLLDAILIVQTLPRDERIEAMMLTAFFVSSRLDEKLISENPSMAAGILRYEEIVTPHLRRSMARHNKTKSRRTPS